MSLYWDKVLKILAAVAGAIGGLFGGWDAMMQVLVACMAIDYVTGLIVAWMGKSPKTETGHLDSKIGFIGIAKKGLILLVVFLATRLDSVLPMDQAIFRSMMCWFYIANEGLSMLENLALAGVPFPLALKKALEQIQKRNDDPPDQKEADPYDSQ